MKRFVSISLILSGVAGLFSDLRELQANGVTLLPPPPPKSQASDLDAYPPSYFGRGPARAMSTKTGQMRFEALKDEESGEYRDEPVAAVSGGFQGNGRQPASLSHTPSLAPDPSLQAMRRGGVQEVAIIAGDLGYFPRVFFVNRDIPVRLFVTGASRGALCFLMDSFQVRKQIRSQRIEEISFTPSQPGTYRFHCPVNGMEGTMVVRELASREDSQ